MPGHNSATLLRAICVFVLSGILVAGLWPFRAPRNNVSWLDHGVGLKFGRYGSIVSKGEFKTRPGQPPSGCTIEVCLVPWPGHSGTILAFYQPERHITPFALRQSLGDLALQRDIPNPYQSRRSKKIKAYADDVFGQRKPMLVTITSNGAGSTVFADGVFVKRIATFGISNEDLTGQLVVGNAPATTHTWFGQLRGLAMYDRELTADEVSQQYESWMKGDAANSADEKSVVALYRFDEGVGDVVHNQVDTATDLSIPKRFFVLRKQFLERPWDEFRPDWNYCKDVGINIAGFIPFGFFFCAYFSLLRKVEYPVAWAVALGFAASLTIEVSQAFLPTRDSGMTDLVTNTLGTALGTALYRCSAVQAIVVRSGFYPISTDSKFVDSDCKKAASVN